MKNVSTFIFVCCIILDIYCMHKNQGMYTRDVKTRYNEKVKAMWIPRAAVALKYMEETSKSKNTIRFRAHEMTMGSFDGKTQHICIYLPLSKEQNVEIGYEYNEFKGLLAQPLEPSTNINDDERAKEQDSFIIKKPEKQKGCCSCFFFCCH